MKNLIADAISCAFVSENVSDSNGEAANLVDSLNEIGHAIKRAIRDLGNGNAATEMGAIEAFSVKISETISCHTDAANRIADALESIAFAIGKIHRPDAPEESEQ